jgi:hypothetical protein
MSMLAKDSKKAKVAKEAFLKLNWNFSENKEPNLSMDPMKTELVLEE